MVRPPSMQVVGSPSSRSRHAKLAGSRLARVTAVLATIGAGAACARAAPPQYQAEVLPALQGQPSVFPTAMNEAGDIIGLAASDPFDPVGAPVLYDSGGLTPLDVPPDSSLNLVMSLNDTGLIVGTSNGQAFFWQDGSPDPLPGIGAPGFGYGVNNAGEIAGSEINDLIGIEFPLYWPDTQSPGQPLQGVSMPVQGAAFAINNAGQLAGAVLSPAGFVAARWANFGVAPTVIGGLDGASLSEVLDINAGGDLAGRSSFPDFSTEAMLYDSTAAEVIGLGTLGGNYSFARSLNDARQVVGEANANSTSHGFLWQDGEIHDLNELVVSSDIPFDYVFKAVGINNAGQIAAEVVMLDGSHRAARLTPLAASVPAVSAPGLAVLVALLLLVGTLIVRRNARRAP